MDFKSKTVDFLKKNRKQILLSFIVIITVSLICITNLTVGMSAAYSDTLDKNAFESLSYSGYDISYDSEGRKIYTPNNHDPNLYLTLDTKKINNITIYFGTPVESSSVVQIYYSLPGEDLAEHNSRFASLSPERDRAIVFLPDGEYSLVRLDINTAFTADRIELSYLQKGTVARAVSIPALVVLILMLVFLLLLIVFERHIGFFAYIAALVKRQVNYCRDCIGEKRIAQAIFRLLTIALFASLYVTYTVVLSLSEITSATSKTVIVLSVLALISFIVERTLSNKNGIAVLFVAVMLIIGCLISFSQPPLTGVSWDDQIHYDRIVNFKTQLFNNERTIADNSLSNLVYPFNQYYSSRETFIANLLAEDSIKIVPERNEDLTVYSSLGYLPSAFAMFVCELFDADILKTMVISRMANVLVYAGVLYFALKMLKSGALIFAAVALMPTSVFLASTFSCDWWITAFIALATAYFLSKMQDREAKLSLKDYIIISVLFILGCGPKAIYFFLMLPMLFVSRSKFESQSASKKSKIAAVIAMLLILATFIVPFLIDTDTRNDYRGGSDVNALEQVKFILKNPFKYAEILFRFLASYVSFENASTYSTAYAYLGFGHAIFGTLALLILLFCVFTDKTEDDNFDGLIKFKTVSWLSFVGQLALVATSLYVSFNPVAYTSIGGCQYRYIIPVLFIACYSLGFVRVKNDINKRLLYCTVFSALAFNSLMTYWGVISNLLV